MGTMLRTGRGETAGGARFRLGPEVRLVTIGDGSARLIDLDGRFYSLSATAAEMLEESLEHGADEAAARIAGRYDAEPAVVHADLENFLRELRGAGLIVPPGEGRVRLRLGSRVLLPALAAIHRGPFTPRGRAGALLTLAWLGFRTLGWSRTVAALRHFHRRDPARPIARAEALAIDAAVREAASASPLAVECKERALACWSLIRAAGAGGTIVVGINTHPLEGHCWCEAGPLVLSDYADRCETFTRIATYA